MAKLTFDNDTYTVENLWQWDRGQELEIHGLSLSVTPEVHFFHDGDEEAIARQATMDASGVIRAKVPNSLLQKPYRIHAIICIYEGTAFRSLCELRLPVQARAKPDDYVSVPEDEVYSMEALGVKATILPPGADPTVSRYLENGEGYFVFGLPQPVSIASIERTSGTGTTGGITITLNNGEKYNLPDLGGAVVMVEISQHDISTSRPHDYSVLLDGEPVTGDILDELYQSGAVIYGLLNGYMNIYDAEGNRTSLTLSNETFQYRASDVFGRGFENWPTFKFHAEHRGRNIMIAYVDGKWESKSKPVHPVVDLGVNYITGEPLVYIDDEALDKDPEYDPIYLRDYIKNGLKFGDTINCYQRGMRFTMEDGTIIEPPPYTPFSVRFTEDNLIWFYAEQDGYSYTLLADPEKGFVATAQKTAPYITAESKGDNLEVDNGELFLMAAGERISEGVPIKSGVDFTTDDTLNYNEETNVLSVNMADSVEADNTRPITAAAVHATVGNIEILLGTI